MRKIYLLLAILFAFIANVNAQTTYYSKAAATNFSDVNSWGTATNGTGTAPTSISNANIFIIQNGSAMTLDADAAVRRLTINAGSLTVAANTLTIAIPSANNTEFNITNGGTLNVSATGTVDVRGAVYFADGSGLNQTGGLIKVDANSGSTASSIGGASGTQVIFGIGYAALSATSAISTAVNAAKFSLTGGTIQIVDPSLSTSTVGYGFAARTSFVINCGTAHTLKLGDGTSTQAAGSTNGLYLSLFQGSVTYMTLGNVEVDMLTGTNRFVKTVSNFGINGNLNITSGEYWINSTNYLAGNLTNAGILTTTSTLRFGSYFNATIAPATTTQTVSGAGTFRNAQTSPTANYVSVNFDNTSAGGVVFASLKSVENTTGIPTTSSTMTFTNGVVDISAAGGIWKHGVTSNPTLSWTSGGFKTGTTLKRFYAVAGTGTTIAAGTNPTFGTGSFPFVKGNPVAGITNYHLHKSTAAITTAGYLAVTFNEGTGVTALPSVMDATTMLNYDSKTNANFVVALDGYVGNGTVNPTFAITMQNTYPATTANTVLLVDDLLVGTHQNGSTYPMAQRAFGGSDVFTGTMRIGVIGSELPNETVASGDWNSPSTWSSGVPACGQNVAISTGHVVTVNSTMTNEECGGLSIIGTLNITGGKLTVGCTNNNNVLNNNGLLNVSGGELLVNGNLSNNVGSTFNQTGGDINIDGNNGDDIATSVLSGVPLLRFLANQVTMTGGNLTIVEPHKGNGNTTVTETAIQYSPTTSPYPTVTTGHTTKFGDGAATAHGNINGFRVTQGTRLPFGNLIINTLSDSADVFTSGSGFVLGDLTITRGELAINSGNTFPVAGNIVNNDTLTTIGTLYLGTYTLPSTLAPTNIAQTISGTGVFRDAQPSVAASTASFSNLTINNTSTAGVSFSSNSLANGANTGTVKATLTFTAGMVTTPTGVPLTLGTAVTVTTGTLTHTKGGFSLGSSMKRWFINGPTGSAITAAAIPAITANAGAFPFIKRTGTADSARTFFVQMLAGSSSGGTITVDYNGTAGTSSASITDVAYTVETLSNENWTVAQSGFTGTPTYNIAVSAQALYLAANGNSRITKPSAPANGTHQNGTTFPHAQRIGIALADLAATYHIGAANIDIPITTVQSGAWEDPATWSSNAIPLCNDVLVIQSGHTVTVNAAAANCNTLTVAVGGILNVTGNILTVGCTLNNSLFTLNGALNVSGGTVNVNGALRGISGGNSTLTQSGGDINIDANDGNVANSIVGHIFDFIPVTAANLQLTGGTLTLVDPTISTLTGDMTFKVYPSVDMIISSGTHILKFGNGAVTSNGGSTAGYGINLVNGAFDAVIHNLVVDAPIGMGTNRHVGSASIISINNNLTITNGEYRLAHVHQINGNVTNNGVLVSTTTLTLADNSSFTTVASNNAQTIGGAGLFYNNVVPASSTASLASLSINNANVTGVTLNVPLSVSGTLTMTQGIVNTTTTNLLSLGTTTGAGTLTGITFSNLTHINGPFARTFLASRTATGTFTNTTLFPTGKGGSYIPVFIDPTTTATGHIVMKAEVFNTNSGSFASPTQSLSTNRWEASVITNPANFTSTHLRMDDGAITSLTKILTSPTAAGLYTAISYPSVATTGIVNTVPASTQIAAVDFTGFFAYGDLLLCLAPTDQPTAFVVVNKTTTTVNASITAATSNPTGYLVVRYASPATPTAPTNGVLYSAGNGIGTGTVVGNFTTTTQAITGLTANTAYDFYYYSYNNPATCSGPTYLLTAPLVGTVTTCATNTTAPTTTVPSNVTPISFDLTWGTVAGATYQLDVSTNSAYTSFLPGFENKSVATNTDAITGLSNGTIYYSRVRAIIGGCISTYSTSNPDTTIGYLSVASGNWNNPATWTGGVLPGCTDIATIAAGHNVTVNTAGNIVKGVTVNTGGTLTVASGDLTVGCTDKNNTLTNFGTLQVDGGALNVNGNVNIVALSTFNQTGGDIIVDGNSGMAATSVPTGTNIFRINSNLLGLTGGKITIVDPHAGASTSDYAFGYSIATLNYSAGINHTFQFGNGVSTDPGGHSNGMYIYPFVSTGDFTFGNVIVDIAPSANPNRFLKNLNRVGIGGNLTVTQGEYQLNTNDTYVAGNIINNGTIVSSGTLYFANWINDIISASTNAQTVSGAGIFKNSTTASTANFTSINVNNTNATGVTFNDANSLLSGANTGTVSSTLTFTAGKINTGSNAFILGTTNTVLGTMSHTGGGFGSGSTLTRWWGTAASGAAITTGAVPAISSNAGSYPFVAAIGNRAAYLQQVAVSGGGKISVKFTEAAGLTTVAITDGAGTVDRRTNDAWEMTNNTVTGSSTYNLGISAQFNYPTTSTNTRVVLAAAAANGTHQVGTSFPHGQRTGLALSDLNNTYHLGINDADITFTAIASGNWNDPATWNKGTIPTCTDKVNINSGFNVAVNSATNVCDSLVVNTGASITVASGDLTVGCTDKNNTFRSTGTLTVSGGTLNVNGNVLIESGSTFNQSGGEIIVDGNSGTAATSVATGTNIFRINSNLLSLTGGKITIVDPHAGVATSDYAFAYNGSINLVGNTGHTIQFGDGVSTDAGGHSNGFYFTSYLGSNTLGFGNMIINAPTGTNRFVKNNFPHGVLGNLTVTQGDFQLSSTNYIAGNIVNNATITTNVSTLTLGTLVGTTGTSTANVQTITGAGVWRNLPASPTANLTSLSINNTSGTPIVLPANMISGVGTGSVSGTLTLTAGKVDVGTTPLILGTSATSQGTLSPATPTSASYIIGDMHRWVSTATGNRYFPIGTATTPRFAQINFTTGQTTGGLLTAKFNDAAPTTTGLPLVAEAGNNNLAIDLVSPTGSWTIERLSGAGGTYTAIVDATGFMGTVGIPVTDLSKIALIKKTTAGDWVAGADGTATTPTNLNALTRTGCTAFSVFGLGGTLVGLPIKLDNVKATITGATNTVSWTTQTEANSNKFVVQRSTTGNDFTAIGEVATRAINGNSTAALNYSFVDVNPVQGKQYYRLQMVENDGKITYSPTVSLRRGGGKLEIVDVRPNPTTGIVYFNVLGVSNNVNVAVRSLNGQTVIAKGLTNSNGFNIDLTALQTGMYILEVTDVKTNEKANYKVIKN